MKRHFNLFQPTIFLLFACTISMFGKQNNAQLTAPLPVDSNVIIGKLQNGMTYYIRENKKPEDRAELRLAVNAGSVLEDDDQQGIAHFVEHMAFDGTKHFQKQQIIDYMESIGMRFGADLNAYTSFDETVYQLTIPTDQDSIIKTAFQIMEDWAHNVTYDSTQIDKERGVVIEEWRLGRGANKRMYDKQVPVLLKDSRYAVRNTIGKKEILESVPHARLMQFYKDWYRPELMSVVAVGDFDKHKIEQLVKQQFSAIPVRSKGRERIVYPVPDHAETLFTIVADSEATNSEVGVYFKRAVEKEKSVGDFRRNLVGTLYHSMLNMRLYEIGQQPDPPFLNAYSGDGGLRTTDFHILQATVKDNGIERGLQSILVEAERVKRFGFTQTELDREKKELLRSMEQEYNERDKTESRNLVDQYVYNFLNESSIAGVENEYKLYKQYLPRITLDEINRRGNELMAESNRVVMASCPMKKGVQMPTEESLKKVFVSIASQDIKPYEDKVSNSPLLDHPPSAGTITEEKEWKELGVTEWKLSNGAHVILKPTDFKNDEVIFSAYGFGGSSHVQDEDFIPGMTASSIVQEGGVGTFDQVTLNKMLQGKVVHLFPYIDELDEGFSGGASPTDLETMFQLMYLYATVPRSDSSAYLSYKDKMKGFLQNRNLRPETAFQDTVSTTLTQYHLRRKPFSESMLDKFDLKKSLDIYRDRFSDAGEFTFIFIGAFKIDQIKPLILQYVGGLPSTNRKETWKDVGINFPKGVIAKKVMKGIEPKSSVQLIFTGPFEWSRDNHYAIDVLTRVLNIKLREVLREDKGEVYGVGIGATPVHYPRQQYRLAVGWGCAPDNVEGLISAALLQIDSVKKFGVPDIYINKVKEIERREREVNLKENHFWLNMLKYAFYNDEDPNNILKYNQLINTTSSDMVQKAAQKYFDMQNYIKVVLYPDSTQGKK